METEHSAVCKRCNGPIGPGNDVTRQSPSDPLVVSECSGCGAIVGIGGHQW